MAQAQAGKVGQARPRVCGPLGWLLCSVGFLPDACPGGSPRAAGPELMPSPRTPDEDLFRDSTMTFGEHLEELRHCLFMALIGLLVGFGIGLVIGRQVVRWIQYPMERALEDYYAQLSVERYQQGTEGDSPTPLSDEQIADFIASRERLFDQVYVEPEELARALGLDPKTLAGPGQAVPAAPAAGQAEPRLVPLRIWHSVEDDSRVRAKALNFQEGFLIYIKAALLAGAVLSSPWVFWWLWTFVAAGLYPHERRYVYVFLPASLGLFLLGAATAFFFVFEPVLGFLLTYNRWLGFDPEPRISEWLSFVLILPLGFGISFQLPLVMLFLERIGVFDVATYLSKWRVSILVIFAVSMVLTPSDPYSMVLMAVPLSVLYFVGIAMCKFWPRSAEDQ